MGGGGVMVWGMIFANGNIWLEWLKGRQNSESYKQMLDEKALPRIRREMGNDFILQQDHCSIHVSKLMKEWMAKVNMTTLEWPARSPDLNLIENGFSLKLGNKFTYLGINVSSTEDDINMRLANA